MNRFRDVDRRNFVQTVGKLSAGGLFLRAGFGGTAYAQQKGKGKVAKEEDEVGPTEDLMREHGVLNRVLLIYDEFLRQLTEKQDLKPELVTGAASVVRKFVEDYHERQEEQFLFPRFEKAKLLTELVAVLKAQHQAGRRLTDRITSFAAAHSPQDRATLGQVIGQFISMYRPHEAREDTVLFPALRKIVSRHEFDALGEEFEKNERKQFGADGFELYRDRVVGLEKQLGIYNLSLFTPKL